jgi:Tol biopolymer transport system component
MGRIAWLAYDAQPDGEKRGIYLMTAVDGGSCSKRITSDAFDAKQPAFSDDGKFVAYASNESGTYQIYLLELATGTSKKLTDLPGGASYPTISANGLTVAFVTGDPEVLRDGLVDSAPGAGDLMLVSVKTLQTKLVKAADPAVQYPYFSPAFSGNDRIFVANSFKLLALYLDQDGAETSVERALTPAPGVPQDPAPSPDGQQLAYVDSCADWLNLYTLRIDLGSTRNCTAPTREVRHDMGFVSADWGSFGFIVVENNAPSRGLYLFHEEDLSNGGGLATEKLARNPDWAPSSFAPACD